MKRLLFIVLILSVSFTMFAQDHGTGEETIAFTHENEHGVISEASAATYAGVLKYFAAALAVGISCIAGGMAVARIGTAAMGAMSENADLSGKALPYAGLAEGICLWGFLVGLLILLL